MACYGGAMIDTFATSGGVDSVDSLLRGDFAQSESAAGAVVPILRHLLASQDNALFGDDVLARVRGMLADLTAQLLDRSQAGQGEGETDRLRVAALSDMLIENGALIAHLHSLALEWQFTERLHLRFGMDHVLSPLLQALVGSGDPATAALAMHFLASQSRYCQGQRRMRLTLAELPGDLLHGALRAMRAQADECGEDDAIAAAAEARIRAVYDESATRIAMMERLVLGMGSGAIAALSATHAGSAMFLTALSIGSGMERPLAALATHDSQVARLALGLRAAGLKPELVQEQCLGLHPQLEFPEGFEQVSADRAAAILAEGAECYGIAR